MLQLHALLNASVINLERFKLLDTASCFTHVVHVCFSSLRKSIAFIRFSKLAMRKPDQPI